MNELDIQQGNDGALRELALFAGAGGGILGGKLLGWRTVCAVERDAYAAQVLAQRQNDGILEAFPIWSDVQTFDGKPWKGIVDVISGGFPCQDISVAGRGAGIEGERSGMWKEFLRIICDIRPRFVFVENSPMLTSRGLGVVLGDLAEAGYDTEWTCLSAAEVGANHIRDRIWILGYSNDYGQITPEVIRSATQGGHNSSAREIETSEFTRSSEQYAELAYASGKRQSGSREPIERLRNSQEGKREANIIESISKRDQWATEPRLGRVANGVADRMDRLKSIGNGQVPLAAATAFKELINRFMVK